MTIGELKGIGPKTEAFFQKLNIFSVVDLIQFFPRSYKHYCEPVQLNGQLPSDEIAVRCDILSANNIYRNQKSITIIHARSFDGVLFQMTFFHMPFLAKTCKENTRKIVYGKLEKKGDKYYFVQPSLYSEDDYQKIENTFQPFYTLTKGINNQTIKKAIIQILQLGIMNEEDYLPKSILEKESFFSRAEAIRQIHFPDSREFLSEAKRRLAFDEFFVYFYRLMQLRNSEDKEKNASPMIPTADTNRLIEVLPYRLTRAQEKAWNEISNDLCGEHQMNRLVQGDVGSGKTILAILAMIQCTSNSYQCAFMAPLEILAEQHYQTITEMIQKYQIKNARPCLLTSSVSASSKKKIYEMISDGTYNMIIGTHALVQESVKFKNLGLVITDEQHRFGVKQREALSGKGEHIHTLVMSATPIPRSLAIILFGDLDVSIVDMLPIGRLPIKNSVISQDYRKKAHDFILKQIDAGHQAYIICPMVEAVEGNETLKNVKDYSKELNDNLPDHIKIGVIHGKMKPKDKSKIMSDFKEHQIDVLVATTVIEVGVNVPNATVMLIENADRFGLATLHQLRGRIGRGEAQSYCIFLSESNTKQSKERLEILLHSNDGFDIANEDLKLRGPGNLLGIEQSGSMPFMIADIYENANELIGASNLVKELSQTMQTLSTVEKAKIEDYLSKYIKIETYEHIL